MKGKEVIKSHYKIKKQNKNWIVNCIAQVDYLLL